MNDLWKRIIGYTTTVVLIINQLSGVVRSQGSNTYSCAANGNYTSNSTYGANLKTLLNALPVNMGNYGFHTSTVGTANALALCISDRTPYQCRECVDVAAGELLLSCPNQRQGIIWLEFCMLRYSNQPILSNDISGPTFILRNTRNVSSLNKYFREDLTRLLADLRVEAANGTSALKSGAGTRPTPESMIYSLMQCTPDLLSEDCRTCLDDTAIAMLRAVDIARGARMLGPNCIIRYELYSFYNDTRLRELGVLPLLPATGENDDNVFQTDNSRENKNNDTKKVVAIVVPISGCLTLAACALIFLRKRMKRPSSQEIVETIDEISTVESLQYDLGQIRTATADFHDSNKLGQGGFGVVYRGKLQDGQEIAVKRLSKNSGQGNTEFKNEVLLVARLQHRNLVRLLGFSLEGTERLLVYEFVQNASLDQFIFDKIKGSCLDWDTRHKIIGGVARGLLYLHEDSRLRIIHRDLKASNVLLDGDMNPKIADFGMARLFRHDEIQGDTSKIVGTFGYMAPEYAMHGQFSIKSDVFSFGVLVLEIISGKRNNCIRRGDNVEDLLTLMWENWRKGAYTDMIDPLLQNSTRSHSDMLKYIHIGLLCVQENAANRPTMTSVLHMLNASPSTFPLPSEPAFYMASRFGPQAAMIQEYDSGTSIVEGLSKNEISVTELCPR